MEKEVLTTNKVHRLLNNPYFNEDVRISFLRFLENDWGHIPDIDIKTNEMALKNKEGVVLGQYKTCKGSIFVILNYDNPDMFIIAFPEEY